MGPGDIPRYARGVEGLRVGSFTLERPVAAGGMGRVWRAVHRSGAPAAVKIIAPDAISESGPDPVAALQAEIRAIAGLEHPNLVTVYDAGLLGPEHEGLSGGRLVAGSPWLAMELAQGSVHDLVDRLDWPTLLSILLQSLDGLAHAHARGVIHRDLKPANLLFTRATGDLRVLVADFGLAWAWRRAGEPVDGGTAAYSAPEQLLGQFTEQGPWTDLYALGCTAFKLITGKRPYRGQTFEELQRAHLFADLPKLTPRFSIPPDFRPWLDGMMAKDPSRRFQRAADAAWVLLQLPAAPEEEVDAEDERDSVSVLRSGTQRTRTLPMEAWATSLEAPRPSQAASEIRPPVPRKWRRPGRAPGSGGLEGRGLGLFGMGVPPLVAREEERSDLWRALVSDDRLHLVVMAGPPGVGKSRLGAWLCERAHEVGAAEVFRAAFHGEISATTGLAAMVEDHLRTHGMTGAEVFHHLKTAGRQDAPHEIAPERLARLLRPADPELAVDALPVAERLALVWSIMAHRSTGRRLLVWLDDAHRASDALDLIHHLAAEAADKPGLVVVTVDDPLSATVEERLAAAMGALPSSRTRLGPLAPADAVALVSGMLPVPDELARRIVQASGGNPRATVEFVTDLVQQGQLRGDAGRVEVDPRVPLPDSLASLYAGALLRLDVLGPAGREAMEVAAILGPSVVLPEWREACQRLEINLDPQLLATMTSRDFLRPMRGGARYTFGQGVLRDALLDEIVRADRAAALHRACGTVLEARGDARAAAAGAHFEAAGQFMRASAAYLRGMRWLAAWDRERALELGTRWYSALGRVAPPGDVRWAEGMQVLVQLLGVQGGDAHEAAAAALLEKGRGNPQAEAMALIELAHADLRALALQRAAARAELAWHRAQDTGLRSTAAAVRAEVRRHRGEFHLAEQLLRQALTAEPDAAPLTFGLARVLADDGRADEALAVLDAWNERKTQDPAPMMRARFHRARGSVLLAQQRPADALRELEEARELRDRAGFDWPALDLDRAAAQIAIGQPDGAAALLDDLLERLDAERDARRRSSALSMRALMAAEQQDWAQLERCLDMLEDLPVVGRSRASFTRMRAIAVAAEAGGAVALARRARGQTKAGPLPQARPL